MFLNLLWYLEGTSTQVLWRIKTDGDYALVHYCYCTTADVYVEYSTESEKVNFVKAKIKKCWNITGGIFKLTNTLEINSVKYVWIIELSLGNISNCNGGGNLL